MNCSERKGIYSFCKNVFTQSYKNGHIVLLTVLLFSVGCGTSQETAENAEDAQNSDAIVENENAEEWQMEEETMPLKEELDLLIEDIATFRAQAFASENEKIKTSELLIEEVETSLTNYNAEALANIKALKEKTQQALYDSVSLGDEATMLKYDAATEELMAGWSEFIQNTPEIKNHARAKVLWNDIFTADKSDFRIRNTLYNLTVMRYNELLTEKADEINALGEKYQKLELQPLFYGGPAS